ncbi:MAG: hypothetical protein EOO77_00680 [Oxalobacteraceae bacterium]|nr:MAG: hypothetical protein EOO77_00680 [Oxalobacteraceae bacterium]
MIICNPVRLKTAQQLLARFREAGRPPKGKSPGALQASPAGWQVPRETLAAQIEQRIAGKGTPSQVGTSYCGPAAFLYCVLEDRPDVYVAYAISLWMRGSFDFRTASGNVHVAVDPETVREMAVSGNAGQQIRGGCRYPNSIG